MKTKQEIEEKYNSMTGQENSFAYDRTTMKDAEFIRGYIKALVWVLCY